MTIESATSQVSTTYDEVPYTSLAFQQTHPDRLATVARLMGLRPPPVQRCRVLELGCASGGNLLPMAVALPDSRFLGIDLSTRQIEEGRRQIEALGLKNVELQQLDLLSIGPEFGQYDYIICHGVYSWVPEAVRRKILAICAQNLAPNGIAYVSYNTYPGWHMRGMIRDMMSYHARRFREPARKVSQARALLDFLAESNADLPGPYALLLQIELKDLRSKPDDYLIHEHLEEFNEPVYFHQFIQAVLGHGLAYVGEADMGTMAANTFPPKVREALGRVAQDQVQREQYMDFLRNRTFRQTLLCHQGQPVSFGVDGARLAGMHAASRAVPATTPDLASNQADRFTGVGNATITTREPLLKAALLELASVWPNTIPFEELYERAALRLLAGGGNLDAGQPKLGSGLAVCYLGGLVELAPRAQVFTVQPTSRPVACPLARLQATKGPIVTNRRHERIKLNDAQRQLLALLDGKRDHDVLAQELTQLCLRGVLTARHEGQPMQDPAQVRQTVHNALRGLLTRLGSMALLIG